MKILVVDDEAIARRGLIRFLKEIDEQSTYSISVVGEAENGSSALEQARALSPNVIFLDISMPGLNGLEVVDLLSDDSAQVIFVTAHEEFALAAFDRDALDYILKPFGVSRLIKSLDRAHQRLQERSSVAAPKEVESKTSSTRFLAKRAGKVCLVTVDDIIAIESDSNYVLLHTNEHSFTLRATLAEIGAKLDPTIFVRSHRSYIVRINAIIEMSKTGSGDVNLKLRDGTTFPLSRTYRAEFEKHVGRIP
ncbi:MAG: two-component system LytT family response regulator [Planctomycetota bacterium]|jgi:two-component system LytT family response regulator